MKLLDYFTQFLRDKVNLNQSRLDDLDSRVDAITEVLKSDGQLGGRVLDIVPRDLGHTRPSSAPRLARNLTPTSWSNYPRTSVGMPTRRSTAKPSGRS